MKKNQKLNINIYKLEMEYTKQPYDIFTELDEELYDKINKILDILNDETKITAIEKRIFLLYVEEKSLRNVGKKLNTSYGTINNTIKNVKNKIKMYGNFNNN